MPLYLSLRSKYINQLKRKKFFVSLLKQDHHTLLLLKFFELKKSVHELFE